MGGVEFHAVKAGFLGEGGRLGLPLQEGLYLLVSELTGHLEVSEAAGDGAGRHGLYALYAGLVGIAAAVHELGEHLGAALVDAVGQLLELGEELAVGQQRAVMGIVALLVPLHVGEHDEADAAARPALIELNLVVGNSAVVGGAYAHRGHDKPVLQLQLVNHNWRVNLLHDLPPASCDVFESSLWAISALAKYILQKACQLFDEAAKYFFAALCRVERYKKTGCFRTRVSSRLHFSSSPLSIL